MSSRIPQATQLVDLALNAGIELFHDPDRVAYATIECPDGHRETWPVRGSGFKLWLLRLFYVASRSTPNATATADAIAVLEAHARFDGVTIPVATRVALHEGAIYLDLADVGWNAVRIGPEGWSVVERAPVRFRRPNGMQALPVPVRGGRLEQLRDFVNVTDDDWPLVAGWLVGVLRPDYPLPVLGLHGESGTGKSTQGKMLRLLVDPNKALLRSPPRDEESLILQAINGAVVGLENLGFMPDWLSDALCRLSTGAAFGRRTLYENSEETLFAATRGVIYTAIADITRATDLQSRTLAPVLPILKRNIPEAELWAAYYDARPRLLGALLDAVSGALLRLPDTRLPRPPRMADFATFVTAAEPALGWPAGHFLASYDRNHATAHEAMVESSTIGQAVTTFMSTRSEWTGNAKALLAELDTLIDEATRHDRKSWPQGDGGPRALSGKLRMLAPDLRASGIDAQHHERLGALKRVWVLKWRDGARTRDGRGTVGSTDESAAISAPCSGRDGRDAELRPLPTLFGDETQRPVDDDTIPPSLDVDVREPGQDG